MMPIRTYVIFTYYREERIAITTLPDPVGRSCSVLSARSVSRPRDSVGPGRFFFAACARLRRCAARRRTAALGSLYLLRAAAAGEYSGWRFLSADGAGGLARQRAGARAFALFAGAQRDLS